MRQGQRPTRDGKCFRCREREPRFGQRDCIECHRATERERWAVAQFCRFSELVYRELEAGGTLDFSLEEFRASPVMIATRKVWIAGS